MTDTTPTEREQAVGEASQVLRLEEWRRGPTYDVASAWAQRVMAVEVERVALEEALREVHEYHCGCDRPGNLSTCVCQPVVVFGVLRDV